MTNAFQSILDGWVIWSRMLQIIKVYNTNIHEHLEVRSRSLFRTPSLASLKSKIRIPTGESSS